MDSIDGCLNAENSQHGRRRAMGLIATGLVMSAWIDLARADDVFPSKPIRILVPFAPGGPTDLMARILGKLISRQVNQSVIIDNRPGGGGVIAMGEVLRAPADGYTMVFPSILAVTNPALMKGYPFDTTRDFSGITVVGFVPHLLVVESSYPAKTLGELVSAAKKKASTISYGSTGAGTSAHLEGAMFAEMAGFAATHVPYRGAAPALQDLLAGRLQFMFLDITSALPQIRSGRLRALAIATAQRAPILPLVETVAEQGYPGFDVHGWYGLLVKSGTPAAVIGTLYDHIHSALQAPELNELFQAQGITPGGMPPAAYDALIRADLIQWKQTITRLKITLD